MNRNWEKLSPREVLERAIAIEKMNAERYQNFSEFFSQYDQNVSERFIELSKHEAEHEERLRSLYQKKYQAEPTEIEEKTITETPGVAEAPDLPRAETFIFDDLRPIDCFRIGLQAETEAQHFYQERIPITSDPETKALYHELAAYEADHADFFQKELSRWEQQETIQ